MASHQDLPDSKLPQKAITKAAKQQTEETEVGNILRDGAKTYDARHQFYGDNYKHFGEVMNGFFPEGVQLKTEQDFILMGLFQNCVTKMGRYAQNLTKGGHRDSAHDLMVYAAMMEEMTDGN